MSRRVWYVLEKLKKASSCRRRRRRSPWLAGAEVVQHCQCSLPFGSSASSTLDDIFTWEALCRFVSPFPLHTHLPSFLAALEFQTSYIRFHLISRTVISSLLYIDRYESFAMHLYFLKIIVQSSFRNIQCIFLYKLINYQTNTTLLLEESTHFVPRYQGLDFTEKLYVIW